MEQETEKTNRYVVEMGGVELLQFLMIYWKWVEYYPFSEWSWWMILSPTFVSAIFVVILGVLVGLANVVNNKN